MTTETEQLILDELRSQGFRLEKLKLNVVLTILTKLRSQGTRVEHLEQNVELLNDRTEGFHDRLGNLSFTVVTASAAVVVLSPLVKVAAEFAATYIPRS